MNCWYCHNRHLIPMVAASTVDEDEIIKFLRKRKGMLDAVVITGGEPTLQKGLADFAARIKTEGFLVKLDTNGTRPQIIKELLVNKLLDFVAMDIKAPLEKYPLATCTGASIPALKESIEVIKSSGIDYEFRTTFIPQLKKEDILKICREVAPCCAYALQQYRCTETEVAVAGIKAFPHAAEYIAETAEAARGIVGNNVIVRGL